MCQALRAKPFFDMLMDIRTLYSDLIAFSLKAKRSLASFTELDLLSACRLKITGAHEESALKIIKEYLDAYAEYVSRSLAFDGNALPLQGKILTAILKR